MIKQKSLIGQQLSTSAHILEKSQLILLNQSLKDPNRFQESTKKEIFKMKDYSSFPWFILGNLINLEKIYQILALNIKDVLLSRESILTHKEPFPGDKIIITTYLKDAYEKQATSNPIGFIILESVGELKQEISFYSERVLLVRGGFARGQK